MRTARRLLQSAQPVVIGAVFGNDMKMAGEKLWETSARLTLLCAAMALCACNKDSGSAAPAPSATPATRVKPKPMPPKAGLSAAEQTAGMVQAAVVGKSQAPVELKFDVTQRPKVGQPVDINLALIAQVSASPATIQVAATDDLTIAPGGNQFEIPTEEAGQAYLQTLNITPKAEGLVLVNVTISLKHDEILDQRAFSIPIFAER